MAELNPCMHNGQLYNNNDPELFRATVTDQLLDQIMGLDEEIRAGYFTGYEETVSRWNEYCVTFQPDCLEVTFSTYELGPYALGTVELRADYRELAELLGPGGLERLGLAEEEAQDPGGT